MAEGSSGLVPVRISYLDDRKIVYDGLIPTAFFNNHGQYEVKITSPEEITKIDSLTVEGGLGAAMIIEVRAGLHTENAKIPATIGEVKPYRAGN